MNSKIVTLLFLIILAAVVMDVYSCRQEQEENNKVAYNNSIGFNFSILGDPSNYRIYTKFDAEDINRYCKTSRFPCSHEEAKEAKVMIRVEASLYSRYQIPNSDTYISTDEGSILFVILIDKSHYEDMMDAYDDDEYLYTRFTMNRLYGHFTCNDNIGCALRSQLIK